MKNVTKFLALVMVLFATQSFAQTKIGHINMQELINLMPERDSAVIKLENYAKDLDETMQGMQQEFNTKYQTYQQKSGTWTAAILEAKTKELQEMQDRLQMFQQNAQQEMGQLQQTLFLRRPTRLLRKLQQTEASHMCWISLQAQSFSKVQAA